MKFLKRWFGGFKTFKWFEWLFLALSLAAVVVAGIVFHSTALTIMSSVLGIISIFLSAKGMALGMIFEITQLFLFCTISWFNQYYGEVLISVLLSFPANVVGLITWTKNQKKGSAIIKISKTPKLKEWILSFLATAVLSIGFYYMLWSVGTASLLVSTINVALSMLSSYFKIRRCEYNFIFYILSNIISLVLWIQVMVGGDLSYTPTMMNYIIFAIINFYGFFNWVRLKKLQKQRKNKAKNRAVQPAV